jgi:hypothetical protein
MADILDLDELEPSSTPPFQFKFGGETFTCRNPEGFDARHLSARIAEAESDPGALLHLMLGDDQWALLDSIEKEFTLAHLGRLSDDWLEHHGLSVPKSSGSSKRSKATKMH